MVALMIYFYRRHKGNLKIKFLIVSYLLICATLLYHMKNKALYFIFFYDSDI